MDKKIISENRSNSPKVILEFEPMQMSPTPGKVLKTRNSDSVLKKDAVKIPEVLEQIFKYIGVRQLKICRFVCLDWNTEACRALQKVSHVYLHEDSARTNDFQELVSRGNSLGMASPFRRYFLSVDLFRDEILKDVIYKDNSFIVELYMNQSPSTNNSDFQMNLQEILTKSSATLKYLRLALKDGRGSNKSNCVDFIIEIINSSPNLSQLCSSCTDSRVLEKILLKSDLSHVENIYAESVSGQHVRLLSEIGIPNLKSLILQSEVDDLNEDQLVPSYVLQNMVRSFAGTLEELNICWISSTVDSDFPCCPKLKTLHLDGWDGSLGIFDPFRLPALESLFLTNHEEEEDSFFNPHDGVQKLTIECTRGIGIGPEGLYDDEEFDYLLLYSSKQFPKIRYLDLTTSVTDETIRSIIRIFPTLETLILDTTSHLSSHVFTGRNRFALEKFLAEGSNLREIDIMPSLRDLKCLKKLVLGRYLGSTYPDGFCLTNHMIQYGIAEMTSLEELQFNWNPELAIQVFCDNLRHLKKITVNNSYEKEYQVQIRELYATIPQVVLESNPL
ncbi:unnamed protein product [Allacma fusca]|uniref:F-box domain-containing protein n=1 Tax=Allacma fusca TaxID=39272 RepID=A0A8J2P9J4_9HEXA|nr:unnamed protein product [Allacma fusca]